MIVLLVVCFLKLSLATESGAAPQLQCYDIFSCEDTFESVEQYYYYFTQDLRRHEENIGNSGHWEGFKPTQYNLLLSMHERLTDYVGSVDIAGVIVQETSSLAVNVDRSYIQFSARNVSITCCSSLPLRDVCIQNATHHVGLDYTLFSMNDTLRLGEQCAVRFPQFSSYPRNDTVDSPAIGLRISEENGSVVVNTNFKLRYARTVFPCLDHPALKARFNFTIEHPTGFRVLSSTPLGRDLLLPVKYLLYDYSTFELTAAIPTHMFGFALLKHYKLLIRSPEPFHVYVPWHLKETLKWIPDVLRDDIIGNPELPPINSYPINCVVLSSMPASSISSYGLVLIDSMSIEQSINKVAEKLVLYEAILRQFFGVMVTVTDWNDICLPEGLLRYFKFVLKKSLLNNAGNEMKMEPLSRVCAQHRYQMRLTGYANEPMWDTYKCNKRAGVFFQSLSDTFGRNVVRNLLNQLVAKIGNGTAGLKAWDEALASAVSASIAAGSVGVSGSLSGYVEHFFQQRGPMLLFIDLRINAIQSCLSISIRGNVSSSLPIPLTIVLPTHLGTFTLILAEKQRKVMLSDSNPWALVDPDGATCTIKVYNDVGYAVLFNSNRYDPYGQMSAKRIRRLLHNFCYAVMHNLLSHDEHELSSEWRQAFEFAYNLRPRCRCCLVRRDLATNCDIDELAKCDGVSISKLL